MYPLLPLGTGECCRFDTFGTRFWPVLTVEWLCSGGPLLARVPEVYSRIPAIIDRFGKNVRIRRVLP